MRLILAIVVAVTQVAGPWLCCCGPTRAVAVAVKPRKNSSDESPKPLSGCPLCAKLCGGTVVSPAVPVLPIQHPSNLPDPCPCGGVTLDVAAPAVLDPSDSLGEFAASLAFSDPALPEPVVRLVAEPRPPHLSDVPFLPPGERTRVHHVLHC